MVLIFLVPPGVHCSRNPALMPRSAQGRKGPPSSLKISFSALAGFMGTDRPNREKTVNFIPSRLPILFSSSIIKAPSPARGEAAFRGGLPAAIVPVQYPLSLKGHHFPGWESDALFLFSEYKK